MASGCAKRAVGTTLAGYLDGVEGKLDTLHTDLATTLAGYLDTVETKLQSVIDNTGAPSGGVKVGYVGSIATGADSQFGSQALSQGMLVKNISTGGEVLYIDAAATPTATGAFHLYPGESVFFAVTNANQVYMRAATGSSSGKACYSGA